jgi:Na+/H+ antiporter NhaD/arsenite permease-like protein
MLMPAFRHARRCLGFVAAGAIALMSIAPARAATEGVPHLDGSQLGLAWIIPFVGILLSIALFPLVRPHFWHRHFGKIAAFWGLAFLVPFAAIHGAELALYEVVAVALTEYLPFIILLAALFVVAGGVRLKGTLVGTPAVNLGILFVGTAIASWMGTTGACMLLIRPLLRANENRRFRVHTVVFFIFLVGNIGGALTPLGDPPLFLGFLQGVSFFWPTQHLLLPMLLCSVILLVLYAILDTVLFRREHGLREVPPEPRVPLGLEGGINLLLLVGVVVAVLLSGVWRPGVTLTIHHVPVALENLARDLLLLAIIGLSWVLTSQESRRLNDFNWFPIIEVGKLFAAIFVTIVPAIAILRAGREGALADLVDLVGGTGEPNNLAYFWLTGLLSSFLDNAPTYLVFFNMAGADAQHLMGPWATTLGAISAGAVFMGANTYIGNAPNFMVRSIAQERGVLMPSFFGYMLWSCGILLPLFALVSLLFYA